MAGGNGNWLSRSSFTPIMRKHVLGPDWVRSFGTDFWAIPGLVAAAAASTANIEQLVEGGWVGTSIVDTAGAGADFMSAADRAPNHFLTDASGDILDSPAIFGDYDHAYQAQICVGQKGLPTDLIVDFNAAFTVHSADEPTSAVGLFEDGATISTEADQLAVISSDSANFQLAANGGVGALTDTGATDDADWHNFRIRLNLADDLTYWYIDGTVQGSVAITADEAPYKFGMHTLTTNRIALGIVHIWYSWNDWR